MALTPEKIKEAKARLLRGEKTAGLPSMQEVMEPNMSTPEGPKRGPTPVTPSKVLRAKQKLLRSKPATKTETREEEPEEQDGLLKTIVKEPFKIPARIGTRLGELGAASGIFGQDVKRQAELTAGQPKEVDLPFLGPVEVEPAKTGFSGVKQAAGEGLEALSYGVGTGGGARVAGQAAKRTLGRTAIQGGKEGAKAGAVFGTGLGLQKDEDLAGTAKEAAIGAGTVGAFGGALGAAGHALGKAARMRTRAGVSEEGARLMRQSAPPTKTQARAQARKSAIARERGEPVKDVYDTLADEGAFWKEEKRGGSRVRDTIEAEELVDSRIKEANEHLEEVLSEVEPHVLHDLEKAKQSAIGSIRTDSSQTRNEIARKIANAFDAEISEHGRVVNSTTLNRIKRGLYSRGRYETMAEAGQAYRTAGEHLARRIENAIGDAANVRGVNEYMGRLLDAQSFLRRLHGSKVTERGMGGKLASTAATATRFSRVPIVREILGTGLEEVSRGSTKSSSRVFNRLKNMLGRTRGKTEGQTTLGRASSDVAEARARREATPRLGEAPEAGSPQKPFIMGGKNRFGDTIDFEGNVIFRPPEQPSSAVAKQAEAKATRKLIGRDIIRSGDFKLEDVKLRLGKTGRFYLHRKGFSPTTISRQEAMMLDKAGVKVRTASHDIAESVSERIQPVLQGKEEGVTINLDGSEYKGDKAIVTLYSENVPRSKMTEDGIREVIEKKLHVFEGNDNAKVGVFDMGNGKYSVDINVATSDRRLAKQIATQNGQQSYFDPKLDGDNRFVPTGGDGTQRLDDEEIRDFLGKVARAEQHLRQQGRGKYRFKGEGGKSFVKDPEKVKKTRIIDIEPEKTNPSVFGKSKKGAGGGVPTVGPHARKQSPLGKVKTNKPNQETTKVANRYMRSKGINPKEVSLVSKLDKEKSKKIADAFDAMKDEPNNPKVRSAYKALADETKEQYDALVKAGYKMEPWDGKGQPYKNSAEMAKDVRENKHLYFFKTDEGFGSGVSKDHPLLKDSGIVVGGHKMKYNDLFRAVHDVFGHTKRGNQFGPVGEENAWRVHSQMYSPEARKAMTTETRGQNSWVNFGKHRRDKNGNLIKKGEEGYVAPKDRPYAEQKTGLLPDDVVFDDKPSTPFGKGQKKSRPGGKELTLYTGANKKVTKQKKKFDNVLVEEGDQETLIRRLAREGDKDAQEFLKGGQPDFFVPADRMLSKKYKGKYDAIQYKHKNDKRNIPVEYHDLKENRFYSTSEEQARVYALQSRGDKYKSPFGKGAKKVGKEDGARVMPEALFRGEQALKSTTFGGRIRMNKDGIPVTLGGNLGIPVSSDLAYVNKRFVGKGGRLGTYVPKGDIRILSDANEIMRLSGVNTARDFFSKGKIPKYERGAWFKKAKDAGYDIVDFREIERMAGRKPESELRILNPDGFKLEINKKNK